MNKIRISLILIVGLGFTGLASAGITYDSGTNTITVTEYSEASPCTFDDIYNADVANGWNVVAQQCGKQYCFTCKLVIGDGTTETWFKDVNSHITFNIDATGYILETKTNSNFQLGEKDANDRTSKGCAIYSISSSNSGTLRFEGNVSLYNNVLSHSDDDYLMLQFATTGTVELIDIMIWQGWISIVFIAEPTTQNLKRITVLGGNSGLMADPGVNTSFEDVVVLNAQKPFRCKGTVNATNIRFEGESYLAEMNDNGILNMYDCAVSTSSIYDAGSAWSVNEYFHFNLKVIDKDETAIPNADVTIKDVNNIIVFSGQTDINGEIPEQTLKYAERNNTQTRTLFTPHNLKIEKAGYTTYEADFTLEEKTDWLIALNSAAENGTTTETKLISTQIGVRKTTMAAAFMLLSGMFMMVAIKRRQEDE